MILSDRHPFARTKGMRLLTVALLTLLPCLVAFLPAIKGRGPHPDRIKMPPGFEMKLYAQNVKNARSMAMSPGGVLFVGTREAGKVYAIVDRNGDDVADEVITVAKGLNTPNGVAFRDGSLYVAEVNRILRYDGIETRLRNPPSPVMISSQFSSDSHHGWKYMVWGRPVDLLVMLDGSLLVSDDRANTIYRITYRQPLSLSE